MPIDFAPSSRSTIGIEWELVCVDRDSMQPTDAGNEIVRRLRRDGDPQFPFATEEFLTNTVEVVSGPHRRVSDAMGDLDAVIARAHPVARELGVELASAGTHPFARFEDQNVTPGKDRYQLFTDRMQWWGRHMVVWGLHMHVGVGDRERAIAICNAMLALYPHLQALSASSPYWQGIDTGYASNRAMIWQQGSTAGLPEQVGSWAEYEALIDDLVRVGVIREYTELRWDIRPAPKWGTVEVRFCDAPPTAREVAALSALVQCLVDDIGRRLDDGGDVEVLQPWYSHENKWRAARYGLECDAIVNRSGAERPLADHVLELVDSLEPVARRLECDAELRDVAALVETGPSYRRQRRVAAANGGRLTGVVRALVDEFRSGDFADGVGEIAHDAR